MGFWNTSDYTLNARFIVLSSTMIFSESVGLADVSKRAWNMDMFMDMDMNMELGHLVQLSGAYRVCWNNEMQEKNGNWASPYILQQELQKTESVQAKTWGSYFTLLPNFRRSILPTVQPGSAFPKMLDCGPHMTI